MLATVFIIMEIQKYKAKIKDTDTEVIGYITEAREQLGQGTYGNGTDYLISVTEKSMPNGKYGTFKVDKETIKLFNDVEGKAIEKDFEKELFKLINFYAKNGLKKPDLVQKMEYVTKSCVMS
jgi:hypothetical protein